MFFYFFSNSNYIRYCKIYRKTKNYFEGSESLIAPMVVIKRMRAKEMVSQKDANITIKRTINRSEILKYNRSSREKETFAAAPMFLITVV